MNGEYPLQLFVELSDCTDPNAEDRVAIWIRDVHLPDLVASGWVREAGVIYRNVDSKPDAGAGRFLTISPADRWDIDSIAEVIEGDLEPGWRRAGRLEERFARVWHDAYRLCGPTMRPSSSPFVSARTGTARVSAIMVQQSSCPRSNENELNSWYNRLRVPELVAAGPFHTAYRYASCNFNEPQRRFLQIYESDADNPAADIERFLAESRPDSACPPFLEDLGTSVFVPV